MWIDVYSVLTFAFLGGLSSWILQIPVISWTIHVRWLRCVWPMWTFFFWPVLGLYCELLEFAWSFMTDLAESLLTFVTSSTDVAQHGWSKLLIHCALQAQSFHGRTLAKVLTFRIQGVCTLQTAAVSPGKLFVFPFLGGSPDNSGCSGGSVQIKVQN